MSTYLIAITGSLGTGKSLVGDILKEFKFLVLDTDDLVKEVLKDKNKITDQIVKEFGASIINQNQTNNSGYIDKKSLASIVFNDEMKRKNLESIIHPKVREKLNEIFSLNKDKEIIFVLIPLLFESGLQDEYNEAWCVTCDENIQMKRLKNKGYSIEDVRVRIKSQLSQEEKIKLSDFVIDNSKDRLKTKEQVISRLKSLAESNRNLHVSFYK